MLWPWSHFSVDYMTESSWHSWIFICLSCFHSPYLDIFFPSVIAFPMSNLISHEKLKSFIWLIAIISMKMQDKTVAVERYYTYVDRHDNLSQWLRKTKSTWVSCFKFYSIMVLWSSCIFETQLCRLLSSLIFEIDENLRMKADFNLAHNFWERSLQSMAQGLARITVC